jgi:hypothetical protein
MAIKKWGNILLISAIFLLVLVLAPATCIAAPAGAAVQAGNPIPGQGLVGWQSQDIDGAADYGPYFELAVDTNGKPHIATTQSRDEFASSLVYFTRELGVWKKEVVDDHSAVLNDPQITTDLFGQPHIVYGYLIDGFSANYALKYAYKDRFGWHVENLTDTLGQTYGSVSIAVNSRGSPRIAYIGYPGAGLIYTSKDGTGWYTEVIDPEPSNWPVLRLDRNGEPRVLYTYFPTYFTREKRYASRDRGTWTIELLDQNHSGQNYDLELDLLGAPHIAFERYIPGGPPDEVVYMTRDRAGWHEETVAQGQLDDYAEVAVSTLNDVGVSYAETDENEDVISILYAVKKGTGWSPETVATTGDSVYLQPGMGMAAGPGGTVTLTGSYLSASESGYQETPFLATRTIRIPGFG